MIFILFYRFLAHAFHSLEESCLRPTWTDLLSLDAAGLVIFSKQRQTVGLRPLKMVELALVTQSVIYRGHCLNSRQYLIYAASGPREIMPEGASPALRLFAYSSINHNTREYQR